MEKAADVIIVGAGPAGLSCALVLGRCGRSVLVFDHGRHRNRFSKALHGFLSRDGIGPAALLKIGREECAAYGVRFINEEVVSLRKSKTGFTIETVSRKVYASRKICLASGLRDQLPPLKNIDAFYGKSAFHCPYCDGWEFRSQPWVLYMQSRAAAIDNCLRYKTWTDDITLLAADVKKLRRSDIRLLAANRIKLCNEPAAALEGTGGKLKNVILKNGERIPAGVLFFCLPALQSCDLSEQLGCRRSPRGVLRLDRLQQTSVHGAYVAGDLAREMQLAVIAAAEGAKAGVAINIALVVENSGEK